MAWLLARYSTTRALAFSATKYFARTVLLLLRLDLIPVLPIPPLPPTKTLFADQDSPPLAEV